MKLVALHVVASNNVQNNNISSILIIFQSVDVFNKNKSCLCTT